jgi:hypothetical protein
MSPRSSARICGIRCRWSNARRCAAKSKDPGFCAQQRPVQHDAGHHNGHDERSAFVIEVKDGAFHLVK